MTARPRPHVKPGPPRTRRDDREPSPVAYAAEPFHMDTFDPRAEADVVQRAVRGRVKARRD